MLFMEKMHHLASSWVAKAILAAIAISFVVSGMYGYLGSSLDSSAAKVNGEEISQQQFQQRYNEEYQRISQQLGTTEFAAVVDTPEFTNGLRTRVLNDLIDQELVRQYTKELNLAVSDDAIKRAIVTTPAFQENGKFSNEAYQYMLRNNNMNADMYAQYLREALRLDQLQQGLIGTDFLTPEQQKEFAKAFFQQRTVRLAKFPLAAEMTKQSVSEQEIQDYYNKNKNNFAMPEMVKVQYIDLTKAVAEKSIKVTDVEIQQYYQDHKSEFTTKGQQRLAHIQFANEKEANEGYAALQSGTDFAELAKTKSTDKLSAKNGGDLGWLNTGDLPKNFEDAAAVLDVGHYSAPVNVDGSFHIIKVVERKESKELPLDQVRGRIIDAVRQDLLANQFYAIEKQVAEKAFEDQSSLAAAAAVAGVKVNETGYFSRREIPAELNFPVVSSAMFDGDVSQGNVNSESMNVGDQHSILVRVLDHKAEGIKSLDEAKAEISTLLTRQKAEKAMLESADKIVADLQQGKTQDEVKFGAAEQWVYAENKDPALNNVIFAMPKPENGQPTYKAAQANNGDVVIVALDAVKEGDPDAKLLEQLNAQTLQAQAQEVQANLVKSLRAKAKIELNDAFLKQEAE
ncbi:peptidyl-prolyl cis-trans isomerase D [Pasteurella langaaensis DSM 22999]|uniref:Periplasmic chaperone PpiD n=1 Tax=Alitibacter langaaensis DSM 22999 TaxID=1122935 RepID=A0A2U0TCY9_9PAST|nr:peptidylprolyl isomerase [Pasteurella langaaensis]PVX41495.1 peptidyl-prolyl cis-trans isomerase D [Pasteurella langaaensis DSM 22999]